MTSETYYDVNKAKRMKNLKTLDYLRRDEMKNCKSTYMRVGNNPNPYVFDTFENFKNNYKTSARCVDPIQKRKIGDNQTDQLGRYYKGVINTTDCAELGGYMDENDHLCYKDISNIECAQHLDADTCGIAANCKFAKMTNGPRCVSKRTWMRAREKFKSSVKSPGTQSKHPLLDANVLAGKTVREIGKALHDWYTSKGLLNVKTGNGCTSNASNAPNASNASNATNAENTEDDSINTTYTIEKLQQFPFPYSATHKTILNQAFGREGTKKLEESKGSLDCEVWKREIYPEYEEFLDLDEDQRGW